MTSLVEEGLRLVMTRTLPSESPEPSTAPIGTRCGPRSTPTDTGIIPDVHVLAYAFRREAEQHARYAERLTRLVAGPTSWRYRKRCSPASCGS